jgi:hypothetical protein
VRETMATEDVEFTFDETPFTNAMNNMSESFDNMSKNLNMAIEKVNEGFENTQDNAKKTNKEVKKNEMGFQRLGGKVKQFGLSLGNVLKIFAGFQLLKGVFTSLINQIPELGATFKIVGNIVQKNIFFPLRQLLIPLLQKVIDFVKENRSLFVRIGTTIANIFESLIIVAKSFGRIIGNILDRINDRLNGVFKISLDNILELINVAVFKITALFIILETKFDKIFGNIGDVIGQLIKVTETFVAAFVTSLTKMADQLGILEDFEIIFKQIKDILVELEPLFEVLGEIIGVVFAGALKTATSILKVFLSAIKGTIGSIKLLKDLVSGELKFTDFLGEIGKVFSESFGEADLFNFGTPEKVDDAIITKEGKVIKTNPQDNIIATKLPVTGNGGTAKKDINVSVNGVKVDINISGNVTDKRAREVGAMATESLLDKLTKGLRNQLVLEGAR